MVKMLLEDWLELVDSKRVVFIARKKGVVDTVQAHIFKCDELPKHYKSIGVYGMFDTYIDTSTISKEEVLEWIQ